jgi:hypothetical protein
LRSEAGVKIWQTVMGVEPPSKSKDVSEDSNLKSDIDKASDRDHYHKWPS